jgi:hypothetical protein
MPTSWPPQTQSNARCQPCAAHQRISAGPSAAPAIMQGAGAGPRSAVIPAWVDIILKATAVAQVATRVATVLGQVYVPWRMMCVLQVTSPVAPRSHTAAAAAAGLADWETSTTHCAYQQQQLRQQPVRPHQLPAACGCCCYCCYCRVVPLLPQLRLQQLVKQHACLALQPTPRAVR